MASDDRIGAFERWLEHHGTAAQRRMFSRSVVQGFVALAAGQRVRAEHVARGVRFAREAGIGNVAAMEQLGALFLQFEADEAGEAVASPAPPPPVSPPPAAAAPPPDPAPLVLADITSEIQDPIADPSAPEPAPEVAQPAEPESPPLVIRIRPATAPEATAPEATSPPPTVPAPATAAATRPPVTRRRQVLLAAAAGALAIVAVVVRVRSGANDEPAARTAPASSRPAGLRLDGVRLTAQLPPGWREAAPSTGAGSAESGVASSLVFRGPRAEDPDEAGFLATLPLGRTLATGATDAALLEAVRIAERGAIAQLDAELAAYRSAGCEIVTLEGQRVGACTGTAARRGAQASLRTYVRVIGDRQVVALFVARRGPGATAADTARIVGSLAP